MLLRWLKDNIHMFTFWFALLSSCGVLWEEYDPVSYLSKENKETNGADESVWNLENKFFEATVYPKTWKQENRSI